MRTYSADDVLALTGGRVNLKTINNWIARGEWFSPLAAAQPGRPRLLSRMNVIEAVLATELTVAGVSRRKAAQLLRGLAAKGWGGGYSDELPGRFERRPPYLAGSTDWFMVISLRGDDGRADVEQPDRLDGLYEVKRDHLLELLGTIEAEERISVVVPLSKIVAKIDAFGEDEDA